MKSASTNTPLFIKLVDWYRSNYRKLPWRLHPNPYHTYISEIIFQQTRIDQGLAYFHRIVQRYPDIDSLANAVEDEFLKLWQGLGYYSRAHNLLKSAKIIRDKFNGDIPSSPDVLRSLPGIGPYTAAAIASIAWNVPIPVIDGNVRRVVSRLNCISTPISAPSFDAWTEKWLSKNMLGFVPGEFNQAIMEAGALICHPRQPDCTHCPVSSHCCAFSKGNPTLFPITDRRKSPSDHMIKFYLIFGDHSRQWFYMLKRDHSGIWKGLFEVPSIETSSNSSLETESWPSLHHAILKAPESFTLRHSLTHLKIKAIFHELVWENEVPDHWIKVKVTDWHSTPVHRLMEQFLQRRFNITD